MQKRLITVCAALLLLSGQAMADSHSTMDHSGHSMAPAAMDHSTMAQEQPSNQADAMGLIHHVDAKQARVNLTHDPIPALGWPGMTMDLPVSNKVDLSAFQAGDKVHFTVKLGRDNTYRIIQMMKH
ncbi:cation efflux system protein [Magnetococcus marinus MC-1]|uniref:Cation efflux system protein n=1 Tax=Magnetococcus marinus (strain ATCC BAA-1437 / JCM 17883 / MC-1) TaxID=156889 RepID=A0LD29_MAGMM|nr:copper-binding protein [Magnetococcus marinus]ABK45872.1 cation efflux system protein [Magnetococcus marinus MC-1]